MVIGFMFYNSERILPDIALLNAEEFYRTRDGHKVKSGGGGGDYCSDKQDSSEACIYNASAVTKTVVFKTGWTRGPF
jgi:hypothetical protein